MNKALNFFARVFGQTLFAIISFFVIIFLMSLFFIGFGTGLGVGTSGLSETEEQEISGYSYVTGKKKSDNLLLEVDVKGIILGTAPEEEFGLGLSEFLTYGYDVQKTLQKATKDDEIKGIFMSFRTPGGTIFGSQAIYRGISEYREKTGKPVVVHIEGISASGGVMAMVGANNIYADYGSLIGSIGVLGPSLTYFDKPVATEGGIFGGGIVTEGGIEQTAITAGRGKDLGNPFRRPTEEEISTLMSGVENEYDSFVEHVADNRKMQPAMIRNEMGAQIFDNKTAEAYGLIDSTLPRDKAITSLAKLAKLPDDDYKLVKAVRDTPSLFDQLFGISARFLHDLPSARQLAEQRVQREICGYSNQLTLAYHGNPYRLCQ
jgi:protease-4